MSFPAGARSATTSLWLRSWWEFLFWGVVPVFPIFGLLLVSIQVVRIFGTLRGKQHMILILGGGFVLSLGLVLIFLGWFMVLLS